MTPSDFSFQVSAFQLSPSSSSASARGLPRREADHEDVRSYPCRSLESAIKLAERFIAGLSRHSPATADVTKPATPAAAQTDTNPIRPVGEHSAAVAV
jgi:hypothetical protein